MSSQRLIFVDDTDPKIQYSGPWFLDQGSRDGVGVFGPTQNHTLHGIKTQGGFSFSFQGNFMQVWGTNNSVNTSSGWDPTFQCFIDNVNIGVFDTFPDSNNQILCGTNLNDGPHQLVVNASSTTGQPFWFDSLHYAPSSSVSEPVAQVLIENHDLALIYSPGWQPLEGPDADMTLVNGAKCGLNFTGTGLTWFGRTPAEYPHNSSSATYSIDGGAPVTFQLAGIPAGSPNSTLLNQIFFSTPQLPAGPHSLLVTYTGTQPQTPLNVDYIIMTNTSSPVVSTSSSSSSSTSTSLAQPASKSSGTPVGAIVGGVVGGVVAILVAFLIFWLIRRRGGKPVDQFAGAPLAQQRELQPGSLVTSQSGSQVISQYELLSPQYGSVVGLQSARTVMHEDSGIQFSDGVVHLPPEYSKSNPLRVQSF